MKIELKNIQYSDKLSEETNAFSANLYIDGRMAGTASNRGRGGPTIYRADDENGRRLISNAEIFCKGLPPVKFNSDGKNSLLDMDLERYIDKQIDKYLDERHTKKFQKKIGGDMEKGIVFGIPDKSYALCKFTMPMDKVLTHIKGPDLIKNVLTNDIIPRLTEGEIILNTNIPVSIFKEVGLKQNQYTNQVSKENVVISPEKKNGRKL